MDLIEYALHHAPTDYRITLEDVVRTPWPILARVLCRLFSPTEQPSETCEQVMLRCNVLRWKVFHRPTNVTFDADEVNLGVKFDSTGLSLTMKGGKR